MKYLIAAAVAFCFAGVSFADEMPEKATPDSVQKNAKNSAPNTRKPKRRPLRLQPAINCIAMHRVLDGPGAITPITFRNFQITQAVNRP